MGLNLVEPGWRDRLAPFVPLVAAALGWVISDQLGSMLSQARCGLASPLAVGLIGLAGLLPCATGALVGWRVWRDRETHSGGGRFFALLGGLLSTLLSVAIVLQTLSSFIIPPCFA